MKVDSIIILGGGSAGWMTASVLAKTYPNKKIKVIESPDTPIVGVGESTIYTIKHFVEYLGIDEKDFLAKTDGSYKLSIKFTDFYKKGEAFHYPFGEPNTEGTLNKLNDWWYKKFLQPETPYSDYADSFYEAMQLVKNNKFEEDTPYAYHFDATKFGLYLKENYCKPRGVEHVVEDITEINTDKNGILNLNKKHKADLYIDCTGFKSLLLGKTLKEPFDSYEDMLPNNSAWATRIPYENKEKQLKPFTNCTALGNGWVWNIPLWSRIGTGYVYSDKYISDKEALEEFKQHLGRDDLDFKNIKMRVGIHKRLFVKNVVAIGLSAGFIEPLESNGLFSVHEFLKELIRNLNRDIVTQWDKDNFTFGCKVLFRNFAEFVGLHYALSNRNDTKYWQDNNKKTWSKDIIDLTTTPYHGFAQAVNKRAFYFEHGDNTNGGIHTIAAGMHWSPTELNNILWSNLGYNKKDYEIIWLPYIDKLDNRKKDWSEKYKNSPTLYKYLKEKIYNENSTT
jgi:flavin-dependent dehydrogenase